MLPFVHGCFDSVFVKDNAIVVNQGGRLQQTLGAKLIAAPRSEALRLALNWIEVDTRVVLGVASPPIFELLRGLGYDPVTVDLSEFLCSGGSAACLVSQIHGDAPLARRLAA